MPQQPISQNQTTYNAPIIEAVIDFDCELAPGTSLPDYRDTIRDATSDCYPESKEIRVQKHTLTPKQEGVEHQVDNNINAIQCISSDEKQLIQFRSKGFSFNRLSPYTSLDDYLPEIARTWDLYRQIIKPAVLQRISMRYINRIPIPIPSPNSPEDPVRLKDYFTVTPPQVPKNGLNLIGLFQSLRFHDPRNETHAQLTLATENPTPETVPVVVDIEAFLKIGEEPQPLDHCRENFDILRDLKNYIYETTLTPTCQSLFQQ